MKITDMTITYRPGMTGMSKYHPVITFDRIGKAEEIGMNTSQILLGTHIGTHMDAPYHAYNDGASIEETPLDVCMGDITVVDVTHRGRGDWLHVEDLEKYDLKERVYLKFGWDRYYGTEEYNKGFPYIGIEAAEYMLEKGVKLVAIDSLSPDKPFCGSEDDFIVHRTMLANKVTFVEALINSHEIDPDKEYTFIALPLKLEGMDASPCRVVMIEK